MGNDKQTVSLKELTDIVGRMKMQLDGIGGQPEKIIIHYSTCAMFRRPFPDDVEVRIHGLPVEVNYTAPVGYIHVM